MKNSKAFIETPALTIEYLREQTLGDGYSFKTPFGERLMTYADYTASGRNLRFIENYLLHVQQAYANTHTEDDVTGKQTTELLHEAETRIKAAVNGDDSTCVIATGSGATGAIQALQKILGVYIAPATRKRFRALLRQFIEEEHSGGEAEVLSHLRARFERFIGMKQPVTFVGPYEHHSNEVTWRECLTEVVRIGLTPKGTFDLDHLNKALADPRYAGRMKIGSFSAASNVTGVRTPVFDIARIMHAHGGVACFDFATCAPYVEIDMNRDEQAFFDAVFISPHKFLGGPGSAGLLLFNERIYHRELPPTCGGGGTVSYVGLEKHDFLTDIEERERAGTPGALQVIRAALAFETKESIGAAVIESIEQRYIAQAMRRLNDNPNVHVLGGADPEKRIAILSFNIRCGKRILHPKFVTRLLNDLFGIQTRAGCSCAGPYGHVLLDIDSDLSDRYRHQVLQGYEGIKPGWVRAGFHFTMDDDDVQFIIKAIEFIAQFGHVFLSSYAFDLRSGAWIHLGEPEQKAEFSLERVIATGVEPPCEYPVRNRGSEYEQYFAAAAEWAEKLSQEKREYLQLTGELEELRYFEVVHLTTPKDY